MSFMVEHMNSNVDANAYNCLGFVLGKGEIIKLKKEKASDSLSDAFKRCLAQNYIRATQKKSLETGKTAFVLFDLSPFYDLAFRFHVIHVCYDGTVNHKPDNKPAESFPSIEDFAKNYPEYDFGTALYFVLD